MDKIFFILTIDKYPEGDAGAVREHSFACILKSLGYIPVVVGLGATTYFSVKEYDGVKYCSLRYPRNDTISKAMSYIFYKNNFKKVLKAYSPLSVKGILFVNGNEKIINYIKRYSLKYNIPLYHDSVEWYSSSEFVKGEKSRGYKKNNKLNTEIIDKKFKVFAISSFLQNHFKSRGIDAVRVPVIMDTEKINFEKNISPEYIKIVYAGQMGKKDIVINFVKALSLLTKEELSKIKICLIGMTKAYFEEQSTIIDEKVSSSVTFIGRVPRADVLKHLESADFTILLRPEDERYAKAGFPTKAVESLSTATPVICNYTSDLKMYLKDGENSIIVENSSVEACAKALRKAINMSVEERQIMQTKARKTAEEDFDYRVYISKVSEFL